MRLDRAVALRIEIERMQSEQMAGEPVDIRRLTESHEELAKLLPPEEQS
jgi:hypothetical protein